MSKTEVRIQEYDVCVIGSGAGGGPVAYALAAAGFQVAVLEKGDWFTEADFFKDEMLPRKNIFQSRQRHEHHVLVSPNADGSWSEATTAQFWGGNIVGGASNFMSAYFHRLKPVDFRLLSTFGPIAGANVADWPIGYEDLEPWYTRVEQLIGISGRVVEHPFLEPRSTADFPLPPTAEHPISARFDRACNDLGLHPLPMARGILSRPAHGRKSCEYSGYCGSYGCATGAKGSARAALLDAAVAGGNCRIITRAKAYRINTGARGNATSVDYFDRNGESIRIRARVVAVACYAIESVRLLLGSPGQRHPDGIGNHYRQIGRNLHCSAGGTGHGIFDLARLDGEQARQLHRRGPFVNRALQDWYIIDDKQAFDRPIKGGTIDFVFDPPAPTAEANALKWEDGRLRWGAALKHRIKAHFQTVDFKFEVFCDWLPNDECHVSLDTTKTDIWGTPVARVKVGYHPHDLRVGEYLVEQGKRVMRALGAHRIHGSAFSAPTSNLIAGGLRFGTDPRHSALDVDCRVHGTDNIFVTDGSFMPNGGSVTPTWTIYANAFRVADKIRGQLAGY